MKKATFGIIAFVVLAAILYFAQKEYSIQIVKNQNMETSIMENEAKAKLNAMKIAKLNEKSPIMQEIGLLSNIVDLSGSKTLDIDAIVFGGVEECDGGIKCIINEVISGKTLIISDDVQIIMQTASNTGDGNFNRNEAISFDTFKKLINDTKLQFKDLPYTITIENDVITKIEEIYLS